MKSSGKEKVNCHRCRHYYITWDKRFPYGCREMGFKSRFLPSDAVYQNSGMACLGFVPKAKGKSRKTPDSKKVI
ncbi:MAG: uracil-DNA glycosylase [Deltaproteobacteria bacterium]|nr:uracil-DNA glycosylase [Deltaproteobacteria bacterium]